MALLAHATLALAAGLLPRSPALAKDFVTPLSRSALVSSFLALPLLLSVTHGQLMAFALYTLWLAGLWFVVSWLNRWPVLFAAFQGVLGLAVVLGIAAWRGLPRDQVLDLPELQLYALGVAALSLLWVLARHALRESPTSRLLLDPGWPTPDRVMLIGLLPVQLLLAIQGIAPGIAAELGPRGIQTGEVSGVGAAAWVLLGILVVTLVVEARERVRVHTLLGLLVLGLTVPVLIAGAFADQRAVASALRWGLGTCFVLYSVPLWWRSQLAQRFPRVDQDVSVPARWLLIAGTVVPVLLLTVTPVFVFWSGHSSAGVASGSWFLRIPRVVVTVLPLVLVCFGLIGHALREQSPGYAFAVGVGMNLGVSLIVRYYHRQDALAEWWIYLVQANVIAFGVTALLWLGARRHLYGSAGSGPLLGLQVALAPLSVVVLLGYLAVSLVSEPATVSVSVAQGGGWPGWVALALAVGVVGWHLRQRAWRSAGQAVFALLVAVPVLAACVAARWSDRPWLAYHVLAAGWATAATLVLACGWRWTGERRIDAVEPTFPAPLVCTWIQALTALLVGLGLREMAADPASPWWPMATVLAAGGVAAATAVWQRSTGWAFSAGLALNLAVSLVLWHGHHEKPFEEWWVQLVQANVLAWAGGALLWLAVRRRLYGSDSRGMPTAPLLSLQVGLGLLGSAALLVGPAIWLISQPDLAGELARASMAQAGHVWSWLALVVALAAAGWHARQALAHAAIHVVGTVGVVVGVLAACTAARWHPGDWLGYHVLTAAWALVGIGLLAPAYRRPRRIEGAETVPPIEADAARVGWVTALAVLVAGLALRGAWEDPGGSWWSASALLAVSGLAVGLALWQGREGWMLAAGVAVNLAISLILWRTDPGAGSGRWWVLLAQANILTGTAVALVWQGFSRRLYGRAHPEIAITPLLNMQLAFVLLGGIALLAGPAELLLLQPGSADEGMRQTGTVWGWLSFVGATGAAAWHMRGRLVGVGVHILCGMGLGLAVLAACTANTWETDIPWVSYHTLTAACALLGVATLAGGWSIRRRDATETTLAFGTDAVAGWAATFTGLALGLALRGLEVDPLRPWWPAGVALVAGGVCGGLALRQRREWWAFAAGLTVNLAISLLLWAGFQTLDREERWVALVQANVLAGAGVAVLWLLASRRLYGDRGPGITAAPLLGVQVGLILLGNAALLVGPAVRLIAEPYPVAESVRQAGQVWSWLALLAALVVGVWYAGKTLAAGAGHIVRGLGLAVGILAACTVTTWQQGAPWLGYYMLLLAWVLTGWATLLMGWLRTGAAAPNESERGWGSLPSARVTRGWVAVISLLVVGLAVREANWPGFAGQPRLAGVVLTVAGLLAATAVWARREVWAFAAALTVNFAVSLFVWDLYSGTPLALWWSPLLRANLIAVAVVALVWLFLARRLVPGRPGPFTTPLLTLQTAAGSVGAVVLVALPAIWLIRQPESLHSEVYAGGQLAAWLSLLLPALAAAVYLHHSTDRVSLHLLAPVGLAVGVLTACMLGHWDRHDWLAYHTLLVAWVVAALAFLTLAWGRSRWYATSDVPSVKDLPATVVPFPEGTWLTVISLLVVGLSLRGVGMDPGRPWWSAGAILAVSVLAGIRALWQRQEGWALTAGLGVNLAVSLVFWELHHTAPLELWLPRLIQANVIVCSGVALMWVALRPRLDPEQRSGPLLGLQLLLAVGGNIVLLAVPLALLVARPWTVNPLVREAGEIWGWLALLPALAASAWHCRRVTRSGLE